MDWKLLVSLSVIKPGLISLFLLIFLSLIYPAFIPALGDGVVDQVFQSDDSITDKYLISSIPYEISSPGVYFLNCSGQISGTALKVLGSDIIINGMKNNLSGNLTTGTYGVQIEGNSGLISNISIINITLEKFDIGLRCNNSQDITLSDIDIGSNLRAGIQVEDCKSLNSRNIEVKNNHNNISGGSGLIISKCSDIFIESPDISGNGMIKKSDSGGILISNSSDVSVVSGVISKNPGTGIIIDSGGMNNSLLNCEVSFNQNGGVLSRSNKGFALQNTVVANNKGTGIEFINMAYPIIRGNKINNSSIGLSISDSLNMEMSGTQIKDNKIGFDIQATDIRYYDHKIEASNTIDGRKLLYLNSRKDLSIGPKENPSMIVAVNCSDIRITDLVLSKNGAGIILAGSHNITLSDLSLMENGIGILSVFNTHNCTFTDLHAEKSLVSGYYFSGSWNIVNNFLHVQDSPSGIYLKDSPGIIIRNITVSGIHGSDAKLPTGLSISRSPNVSVTHASITECSYAGLISDSNNLTINNSDFSQNGVAGCILLSGPVELRNSLLSNNKESGLLLKANNTIIISNTFYDNKKRGIGLISSNNNYIVSNSFQNNKNSEITGFNRENIWNSSIQDYPDFLTSGGNYWGNISGTGFSETCRPDKEGFCIDPYIIGQENIDFHPLSSSVSEYDILSTSDLNRNGRLDLSDVVLYMKNLTSGNKTGLYDVNGDKKINLKDVVDLFVIAT